jgi:hypothetical protein
MRALPVLLFASATLLGEAHAQQPPKASKPPVSWDGATAFALARPSADCAAVRLGEWTRIRCRVGAVDVILVGGSHEGVVFREAKPGGGVDVMLRTRPGDRREIAITSLIGHSGYTIEEAANVVISELWLPGEAEPTIAVARNL